LANNDLFTKDLFSVTSRVTQAEAYRGYNEVVSLRLLSTETNSQILNVQPNPWIEQTKIVFSMEEDEVAVWDFFDSHGRQIYRHEQWYQQGKNNLIVESDNLDVTGVIFIKMTTKSSISEYKMIKL